MQAFFVPIAADVAQIGLNPKNHAGLWSETVRCPRKIARDLAPIALSPAGTSRATRHELFVGLRCRRKRRSSSGAYRSTYLQTVTLATESPRGPIKSSLGQSSHRLGDCSQPNFGRFRRSRGCHIINALDLWRRFHRADVRHRSDCLPICAEASAPDRCQRRRQPLAQGTERNEQPSRSRFCKALAAGAFFAIEARSRNGLGRCGSSVRPSRQ
jgi:hypothetical protein